MIGNYVLIALRLLRKNKLFSFINIVGLAVLLIGISFTISIPLGYYLMNRWLEGFACKINLGIEVFIIAGLISFAIAWLTISFESIRAASKNPVDSIRIE